MRQTKTMIYFTLQPVPSTRVKILETNYSSHNNVRGSQAMKQSRAGAWEIHSLYYFSAFVCDQKYISLSLKCKWLGLSLSQTQVGLGYHR